MSIKRRNQAGQAVAEFAAVIPLVVLFMVLLVEVGLVMVDQLAVERAAREAARTAAITASPAEIQMAAYHATELSTSHMKVEIGKRPDANGMVRVTVRYQGSVVEPFTGAVLFHPQLHADASMHVEDQAISQ
jgi:Flp pilus assembly protein TadG